MRKVTKQQMRRSLMLLYLFLLFNGPPTWAQKIAVGAIRWDAWVGDTNTTGVGATAVGLQVERGLSPNQYHYRAPFFSKVISPDSIQCRGMTQKIMDQEIAYAKDAGIDYWAFCWYPFKSGMDRGRTLYLKSKYANDVKWCIIIGANSINIDLDGSWLMNQFKKENYQKVAGGRPLVYIYEKGDPGTLEKIRELCKKKGILPPYVSVMTFTAQSAFKMAKTLNADAISSYKSPVGRNGAPYYPVIPRGDSTGRETYSATGMPIIPWVTTGRNLKPRIDHPVTWQKVPADQWVADGTPGQIADNLAAALKWTREHQQACPAATVIMYAWNEFDEGGWICPTLGNNTSRLDAIQKVLATNK